MAMASTQATDSAHEFLKQGTFAAHMRIEALSPLGKLLTGELSDPRAYGSLLSTLYELLFALEEQAESAFFSCPDLVQNSALADELRAGHFLCRRQLLRADLETTGQRLPGEASRVADLRQQFLSASHAMNLGLAYVLMGQSLGSAQIHRGLCAPQHPLILALGHAPADPHRMESPPYSFLWGYGRKTSKFWSIFLRVLETELPAAKNDLRTEALAGALLAFQAFEELWKPDGTELPTSPSQAPPPAAEHLLLELHSVEHSEPEAQP